MGVTYKPLWKLLIDREIKKTEMSKAIEISSSTLSKLGKDQYVSLDVLVRICKYLNCQLSDICKINH
ncbi:MAG: helix-turn-helix transcriptional regulator [Tissierellia bacterium]|nr:helix-turn-helix transcriptional regulator [Tissierellia bacterium]